jgi:ferrous iron transport protein B
VDSSPGSLSPEASPQVARPPAHAGTTKRIVLVGRPNSGKSSLYNVLSGGNAKVGNYPGVTVDILEASVEIGDATHTVVDLPGIYTLSQSVERDTDEGVARHYLQQCTEANDTILIQVIDGTRLELGLQLTRELLKLGMPLGLAITQQDRFASEGLRVDLDRVRALTGLSVSLLSNRTQGARETLVDLAKAVRAAEAQDTKKDWLPAEVRKASVTRAESHVSTTRKIDAWLLHPILGPIFFLSIMGALFALVFRIAEPATALVDASKEWLSRGLAKALPDGLLRDFLDEGILGGLGTVVAFIPQVVLLACVMELLDASGYLARGTFLLDQILRRFHLSGRSFMPLLMGHACAVPAITATRVIRDPKERLATILVLPLMQCSARLPTYGLVLSVFFSERSAWFRAGLFVLLYFSGILSALLAALILRRTSIKGRSLPVVMEMPAYLVPQLSVVLIRARETAKHFLKEVGTTILVACTILWVLLHIPVSSAPAVVSAQASTTSTTMVAPSIAATAPPAVGSSMPTSNPAQLPTIENHVENDVHRDASGLIATRSVAAMLGRTFEPLTKYAGFDWRMNVALIGSLGARELMVSTLGIIMEVEADKDNTSSLAAKLRGDNSSGGMPLYPLRTGLALLAFFVLACQCTSTLAAIRRETKSLAWPAFVLLYTYALAFAAAVLVFQGARVFGL